MGYRGYSNRLDVWLLRRNWVVWASLYGTIPAVSKTLGPPADHGVFLLALLLAMAFSYVKNRFIRDP